MLVPPGEILKIGPGVKGYVYVHTEAGWVRSGNKVDIPEGWYAVPPEEDVDEEAGK